VASVSGTILAVCSCTVLPLFAGIYTRGAGIGPATAFLYSGPAINVLAIVLTARILGWQLGLARAIGAVLFAVITGLLMAFLFRKDDASRMAGEMYLALGANFFASVSGALMYFATLTEVPILQGLIGAGMGKGPALSLLLAGPALSFPNMLVIGGVMGVKKTATFCGIIVILSTIAGMGYGCILFKNHGKIRFQFPQTLCLWGSQLQNLICYQEI
jgi:uncharacterized membrane protein YraQ (UPF0718 family)